MNAWLFFLISIKDQLNFCLISGTRSTGGGAEAEEQHLLAPRMDGINWELCCLCKEETDDRGRLQTPKHEGLASLERDLHVVPAGLEIFKDLQGYAR